MQRKWTVETLAAGDAMRTYRSDRANEQDPQRHDEVVEHAIRFTDPACKGDHRTRWIRAWTAAYVACSMLDGRYS
jgi:hypothetical protein